MKWIDSILEVFMHFSFVSDQWKFVYEPRFLNGRRRLGFIAARTLKSNFREVPFNTCISDQWHLAFLKPWRKATQWLPSYIPRWWYHLPLKRNIKEWSVREISFHMIVYEHIIYIPGTACCFFFVCLEFGRKVHFLYWGLGDIGGTNWD